MCRHLGYHTDLAANGAEVLARLDTQAYDLILLDVQMPVLDGLSAAREICLRNFHPGRRPRLVAVTASVQPGDRERCLAAGMDDYLSKPVLPKNLHACIERLFDGRAPFPASTDAAPPRGATSLPPWVDRAHLAAITDGLDEAASTELITQIYTAAKSDFAALRPRLAEACAARQIQQLAACVHGLKGCVLSLGWTRMSEHCAETLRALTENRFAGWADLPNELDELYHASAAELERALVPTFANNPSQLQS